MADNASHTGISIALTIKLKKLAEPLIILIPSIAIINFLVHFLVDSIPHGHYKNKLLELGIGFLLIGPSILYVINKQSLFTAVVLIPIGVFFGNIFDFLLVIAEGKKDKWSKTISNFNLWIHWFVRKYTFLDEFGLIEKYKESEEEWKGVPVYSLKFGWYNFIPMALAIISLISV